MSSEEFSVGLVVPLRPEDLATVVAWWPGAQGVRVPDHWYPGTGGFWVPGIAAGWLELVVGTKKGLISDFVANPLSHRSERSLALDAIAARIEDEARACGCRYLVGSSRLDAVWNRAMKHGYQLNSDSYRTFCKVL